MLFKMVTLHAEGSQHKGGQPRISAADINFRPQGFQYSLQNNTKRLYIATNNIPEQMVAQMISSHYVLLYCYTGVLP